jgi:hypothetical protein
MIEEWERVGEEKPQRQSSNFKLHDSSVKFKWKKQNKNESLPLWLLEMDS